MSFQLLQKEQKMAGVIQFYEGQNILVTGASGFLGKVLLEKLLRACPDVGNIFVLLRPKKGKEPNERVQDITSLPVIKKRTFSARSKHVLSCEFYECFRHLLPKGEKWTLRLPTINNKEFIISLNTAFPAENLTQTQQVSPQLRNSQNNIPIAACTVL